MIAAQNNLSLQSLKNPRFWLGSLLFAALALWAQEQFHLGINTNATWLTTTAMRLLEGKDAAQNFYETNPPLSILLYLPVALSIKIFGIGKASALFFYGAFLSALSIAAFRCILRANTNISANASYILLYSYILAVTILPGYYFGDREHIVMLGLLPLSLYLCSYDHMSALSSLTRYSLLIMCSIAVLIKPQFLLVPGLFFLHRLAKVKSLRVILEPPYLVMGTITLAYIGMILTLFRSYVDMILPDMILLYSGFIQESNVAGITVFLSILNLIAFAFALNLKHKSKNIAQLLFLGGFVGLISFYLQNKGFYYHLIPFFQYFGLGMALLIATILERDGKTESRKNASIVIAALFALIFSAALNKDYISPILYPGIYMSKNETPHHKWPTHEENKNTPLVKLIKTHANGGSYFIMASMPMVIMPSVYSGAELASRFPAFWFMPFLIHSEIQNTIPENVLNTYKTKYAKMVTEDLKKYEPEIIIIEENVMFTPAQQKNFSFETYFSIDPEFKKVWQNYKKSETIELNTRDYYRGYNYGNQKAVGTYSIYLKI